MTTPQCGLLFHFTHVDNLPGILAADALLSDAAVCAGRLLSEEAGDPAIKERRRSQPVTCAPRGVVADYVPFYLAARSPMMYVLYRGRVPTFTGDHHDLVYLVGHVDRVAAGDVACVLSDRNAAKALAAFSNDVSVLGDLTTPNPTSSFVDWPLMQATMWNNTPDDGERMERRMAEFLVHDRVPLGLLDKVAVQSASHQARVERAFAAAACDLRVVVQPSWYYP
jgi:hypothetical protein